MNVSFSHGFIGKHELKSCLGSSNSVGNNRGFNGEREKSTDESTIVASTESMESLGDQKEKE